jgi:hypothetical protein
MSMIPDPSQRPIDYDYYRAQAKTLRASARVAVFRSIWNWLEMSAAGLRATEQLQMARTKPAIAKRG